MGCVKCWEGKLPAFGRTAALLLALATWLPVSRAEAQTAPAPAAAAPTPDDAKRMSEAKERFLRGLDLAGQDNWDAALVEFMASRELYPTRVALVNAALSLRTLKRYAEAIEMNNELVQKFGPAMTPEDRKKVDDTLAELRAYVGEIDVESDQKDSVVVIDGQQRGTTPLPAPLVVNVGTHSVRVSHEGFEAHEEQLPVAGKQRKLVRAALRHLAQSGIIIVKEASGQILDVVVDGAVVGKTPWQGSVAVGMRSVALRGEGDLGSLPGAATVKEHETTTVTLVATKLDAQVRIEPVPASARTDIDGVTVGTGIWQGQLTSGSHQVEIYAPGHVPYRKRINIKSGQREIVRVALERDLSNPMWAVGFRPHLFVEVDGGLALAGGFGTSADSSCSGKLTLADGTDVDACSKQSAPLGFMAGARAGYQLTSGLAVEAFVGYLAMSEEMTRAIVADGETRTTGKLSFSSAEAHDSTSISGPLAAFSASYQFFDKTPLLVRLWGGVMRARVAHELSGTLWGQVPDPGNDPVDVSQTLTIREPKQNVWMPLVGPEVRFGYRFSKRFVLDLGVAGLLFLGPGGARRGGNVGDGNSPIRKTSLAEVESASGARVQPGVVSFKEEATVSTFFGVVPSIGARVDF